MLRFVFMSFSVVAQFGGASLLQTSAPPVRIVRRAPHDASASVLHTLGSADVGIGVVDESEGDLDVLHREVASRHPLQIFTASSSAASIEASSSVQITESIRHSRGKTSGLQKFWPWPFSNPTNALAPADVFQRVALNNEWSSTESISGTGSELKATADVRSCLGRWFKKYNVTVWLDIPCGDGNWQSSTPGIQDIEYYGFDIAPLAVTKARSKNTAFANMRFDVFDLASSVPRHADLMTIRDLIQHLPLDMGLQALRNAKSAGVRWLAVSTYPGATNRNIDSGNYFMNNIQSEPFNFGAEVETCQDYSNATAAPQSQIDAAKLMLFDLRAWSP